MPFGREVADRKRHSSRLSSPNFGSDLCPVFKTRALKYDCRLQNPDRLSEEVHLWRPHRATKVRRDASANVASGLGVGYIAIGDSKAGASSNRKSRLWRTDARPRIGDRCRGESRSGGRQSTGGVPRHSSRARRPPPLPDPPSEPGIAPFHSDQTAPSSSRSTGSLPFAENVGTMTHPPGHPCQPKKENPSWPVPPACGLQRKLQPTLSTRLNWSFHLTSVSVGACRLPPCRKT